jgi:MoxR-like ATPase
MTQVIKKEVNSEIPELVKKIEDEVSTIIVGQKSAVRDLIRAIFCNGHVLVEGVPGIAKTLIVKSLSSVMGCEMKRVQFTVDLLPTDITGITTYDPKAGFQVIKGPIFANFVIADEINRSPPKTQSALLEAMEEKTVTIGKQTFDLPKPFFVMATENPIEVSGVYTLPEAQIDRFLFKVIMSYPNHEEELKILTQNVSLRNFGEFGLKGLLSPDKIIKLQEEVKKVYSSQEIKNYIVKIINETRNKEAEYSKYISYGASPRASISLYLASKAEALMNGRNYVVPEDVNAVVGPVLRHRIILNYEAEAEKITTDQIIKQILEKTEVV